MRVPRLGLGQAASNLVLERAEAGLGLMQASLALCLPHRRVENAALRAAIGGDDATAFIHRAWKIPPERKLREILRDTGHDLPQAAAEGILPLGGLARGTSREKAKGMTAHSGLPR